MGKILHPHQKEFQKNIRESNQRIGLLLDDFLWNTNGPPDDWIGAGARSVKKILQPIKDDPSFKYIEDFFKSSTLEETEIKNIIDLYNNGSKKINNNKDGYIVLERLLESVRGMFDDTAITVEESISLIDYGYWYPLFIHNALGNVQILQVNCEKDHNALRYIPQDQPRIDENHILFVTNSRKTILDAVSFVQNLIEDDEFIEVENKKHLFVDVLMIGLIEGFSISQIRAAMIILHNSKYLNLAHKQNRELVYTSPESGITADIMIIPFPRDSKDNNFNLHIPFHQRVTRDATKTDFFRRSGSYLHRVDIVNGFGLTNGAFVKRMRCFTVKPYS